MNLEVEKYDLIISRYHVFIDIGIIKAQSVLYRFNFLINRKLGIIPPLKKSVNITIVLSIERPGKDFFESVYAPGTEINILIAVPPNVIFIVTNKDCNNSSVAKIYLYASKVILPGNIIKGFNT